jgi:Endonuclease/Exonuclease/phosphatase family
LVSDFLRRFGPAITLAVLVFFTFLFTFRPDVFTALTIIPAWCFAVFGLLSTPVLCWNSRKAMACSLVMWLGFLFVFAEEPYSPVGPSEERGTLRLLTLNWGGAGRQPLKALEELDADILFIQEAPKKELLQEWADSRSCHLVWSPEAAVIAKEPLEEMDKGVHFLRVGWKGADLVSLRLRPPLMRFDLWNPRCWIAYADRRRERRGQLESVLSGLGPQAIVGGDFNVPAGDGALSPLKDGFSDCFATAGGGFGNTAPDFLPLHRIDQVWVTKEFTPLSCRSVEISGSDHRGVLVELELSTPQDS